MGQILEALLRLQSIERQLAEVKDRLRRRSAAVQAQQAQVDQYQQELQALHDEAQSRQKGADAVELELREREEQVARLRQSLNKAKTNKEYAAILTQINTLKADNSKLEEEALRHMQAAEEIRARGEQVRERIAQAESQLEEVKRTSAEEVARLEKMLAELRQRREEAAEEVPSEPLRTFERIASTHEGDAMAAIVIVGKKPPYEYVCAGCNMSITAEHANALRTRDELRFCDCCGRILYLQEQTTSQTT